MKRIFGLIVALLCFAVALLPAKDVHVKGYTRKDGTYVAPHVRTSPNKTRNDNYSTRGNVNPYTGKAGTKPRDHELPRTTAVSSEMRPQTISDRKIKPAPIPTEDSKVVGWAALKSGMNISELLRQLGPAMSVEKKQSFEIWSYPDGSVFVKESKVVAWKEAKP